MNRRLVAPGWAGAWELAQLVGLLIFIAACTLLFLERAGLEVIPALTDWGGCDYDPNVLGPTDVDCDPGHRPEGRPDPLS